MAFDPNALATSPLFNLGLGILANSYNQGGRFAPALVGGLQQMQVANANRTQMAQTEQAQLRRALEEQLLLEKYNAMRSAREAKDAAYQGLRGRGVPGEIVDMLSVDSSTGRGMLGRWEAQQQASAKAMRDDPLAYPMAGQAQAPATTYGYEAPKPTSTVPQEPEGPGRPGRVPGVPADVSRGTGGAAGATAPTGLGATVPVGGTPYAMLNAAEREQIGKERATSIFSQMEAHKAHQEEVREELMRTKDVRRMIDEGMYTGLPATTVGRGVLRVADLFGMLDEEGRRKLGNTTTAIQSHARSSLSFATQQKGVASETDMGLIKRAASGDPTLTLPELRMTMDAIDRINRAKYQIAFDANALIARTNPAYAGDVQRYQIQLPEDLRAPEKESETPADAAPAPAPAPAPSKGAPPSPGPSGTHPGRPGPSGSGPKDPLTGVPTKYQKAPAAPSGGSATGANILDRIINTAGNIGGGLTRGFIGGAADLGGFVLDPISGALNKYAGTHIAPISSYAERGLNTIGVPVGDKYSQAAGTGAFAVLPIAAAARAVQAGAGLLAQNAPDIARIPAVARAIEGVSGTLASRVPAQMVQGAMASSAAEKARSYGLTGWGPELVGMAAATMPGMVGGTGRRIAGMMVPPRPGRVPYSGDYNRAAIALANAADNPVLAQQRLEKYVRQTKPQIERRGLAYTRPSSVASQDPGLLAAHETLRSTPGLTGKFSALETANNRGAREYLEKAFGPSEAAIIESRQTHIVPRIAALEKGATKVDPGPLADKLAELRDGPRWIDAESRAVLAQAQKELGLLTGDGKAKTINPVYLYNGMRKTLNNTLESKMLEGRQTRLSSNAQQLMRTIIKEVDGVIDSGMPGYREYWMKPFASLSQAAERRKIFDDLLEKATSKSQRGPGEIPQEVIMPGTFVREIGKLETKGKMQVPGRINRSPRRYDKLTARQQEALRLVETEFEHGMTLGAVKPRGSDTFKNISYSAFLGHKLSHGLARTADASTGGLSGGMITEGLAHFMRGREARALQIIGDAMVDPQFAQLLLRRGNQMNKVTVSKQILRRLRAAGMSDQE